MNRASTLLISALLFAPYVLSQQPAAETPEDSYSSRELIAWSQLQKPQPAPQPLPPRDTPVPQPEQPQDQQPESPADPQKEEDPAHSYTGKLIKDGGRYVLKVAGNTTYQLSTDDDLSKYENQDVKVVGTLDAERNTIRVLKIELLS